MAVTAATPPRSQCSSPMVFITGVAGQLFRDQSLTVTFASRFSLLVALTLVPMLAAGRAPGPLDGNPRQRRARLFPPARRERLGRHAGRGAPRLALDRQTSVPARAVATGARPSP